MKNIANVLSTNKTLIHVDLSDNNFNLEESRLIGEALSKNKKFTASILMEITDTSIRRASLSWKIKISPPSIRLFIRISTAMILCFGGRASVWNPGNLQTCAGFAKAGMSKPLSLLSPSPETTAKLCLHSLRLRRVLASAY